MLPGLFWSQYWLASLVLLFVIVLVWGWTVMVGLAPWGRGFRLGWWEQRAARLPRWWRVCTAPPAPRPAAVGPSHARLEAAHGRLARTAHDAWLSIWSAPTLLAWLVFGLGAAQAVWTVLTFLGSRSTGWVVLAFGVLALSLVPMLVTLTLRERAWRARAPFEWRFGILAAQTLARAAGTGPASAWGDAAPTQALEQLVERRELPRGTTSDALVAERWRLGSRRLGRAVAEQRARRTGGNALVAWYVEAASRLTLTGRTASRLRLRRPSRPSTSGAIGRRADPFVRAAIMIAAFGVVVALASGFLIVAERGERIAMPAGAVPDWLNGLAAVATVLTLALSAGGAWSARRRTRDELPDG
ncbi:hypothetical protein [Agromyces soli]|uniref:Type II secretion system protein GspF domain-containing protein n=1 Tax=Agromyces soli TaxID=659012 RepID=A0ABY4ATA1_9MICO|nr:hypothetical protein [Agromyces soli]UOE26348.1 hypothetical protein MTP13_00790 [Agromyces soli]